MKEEKKDEKGDERERKEGMENESKGVDFYYGFIILAEILILLILFFLK